MLSLVMYTSVSRKALRAGLAAVGGPTSPKSSPKPRKQPAKAAGGGAGREALVSRTHMRSDSASATEDLLCDPGQ